MASKALGIRDAIIALLTTPALTGIGAGGVSVDPDYAFKAADLPVVAVYLGDENSQQVLIGADDHQLAVTVKVISKGTDSFATGDALMAAVHARIMADTSLGELALDTRRTGTRRNRDVLEVPVAVQELDYAVDYRTTTTSLEA